MSALRKARKRDAEFTYDAISIEGGLLAPEWLPRIGQARAGQQSESDYGIEEGLVLRDEIARYWRMAQAQWTKFSAGKAAGADPRALSEQFVLTLLRKSFAFGSLVPCAPVDVQGRVYPIGFSALGGRVPVVLAPAATGLDTLAPAFGDGNRRRSAFGLAQECLNADDRCLWGLVTDGVTLRLLRDNASLTRPSWIEVDLGRIFAEERYADFTALWLLIHESRFGRIDALPSECPLEAWRNAGREEGTRMRDQLRDGVEAALLALGNGFLNHPDNGSLRDSLRNGSLTAKTYHQQLLRLVYRLIFLLTAEERGVLHPKDASEAAKSLYERAYGLQRLRARSVKRNAHDRYSDLWESVKVVFRGLASGESRLGLPALAGIFGNDQCPALDGAKVENHALLGAMFRLSWLREATGLSRVNWRDMGPEELGSVYESLLELVPVVTNDGRTFDFAKGAETKGNARKTSGSYYTPESLVQVLLDSALEPVVQQTIAAHPANPADALLNLSIVDPACGSGHFLLAAARRLGGHVARLQADGTPTNDEYRHAVRQVVGHCLYGVDLNPMAVELCKVSLWMEAVEPGRPLSFLDSHIRHGNALLGTTKALQEKGIPDEAWEAIEGDDKKIASALKKKNKKAAGGQRGLDLFAQPAENASALVAKAVAELEAAPDGELSMVAQKRAIWERLLASAAYRQEKLVADAWCAAFVWPKVAGPLQDAAPTNEVWRQLKDQQRTSLVTQQKTDALAEQYRFFHWELEFPQVFGRGGFDVVLGNPPWERVKLQEQEFFASRSDEIANAANAAARKKLIAALPDTDSRLWEEWCAASREAEGQSHFVRQSARYPLCGKGDVNTYALFAEHNRNMLGPKGRAGFIVPTGIATDDTTKEYFRSLATNGKLRSLYDFQTGSETFGNLAHGALRFCLLTIGNESSNAVADLFFLARSTGDLADATRHFSLSPADLLLLNPNTNTCPTFLSKRDASLNIVLYRRSGVLWHEEEANGNPWNLRFMAMFHMANDSGIFHTREQVQTNSKQSNEKRFLPLYEAKMIDHFDHRYASLVGIEAAGGRISRKLIGWYSAIGENSHEVVQPQYWVEQSEIAERLRDRWNRQWLLGWRDICRSTDQRTVIASIIPRAGTGDTFLLAMPDVAPLLIAGLYANLCSFALDYAARQKVGGTHLKYHVFKQLPVLPPSTYENPAPWSRETLLRDWILPRVLELTYTAWDLEAFGKDVGYDGPPFQWDPARRFLLRAELDAAFFHLYGISRDDTDYIMDTFPIVRKNDEKAHGEYRTKRVILEVYDALADAIRTGKTYSTRLDPPPADPRVAHPPRS